jgi:hypothetical protein
MQKAELANHQLVDIDIRGGIGRGGMTSWGRNADPQMLIAAKPPRKGLWSLLCALFALGLVVITAIFMANVPAGAPEWESDLATAAVVVAYLIAAPLLHITGVILGIVGLARGGESKLRCVLGILLNVILIAAGTLLAFAAASNIGAFT